MISACTALDASELASCNFETLVFTGGGNQCWWQAGLIDTLCQEGPQEEVLVSRSRRGADRRLRSSCAATVSCAATD